MGLVLEPRPFLTGIVWALGPRFPVGGPGSLLRQARSPRTQPLSQPSLNGQQRYCL